MDRKPPLCTDGGTNHERMSNEEWEVTYDPMTDLAERWGISMTEAENFLAAAGYFHTERYREVAQMFSPEKPDGGSR